MSILLFIEMFYVIGFLCFLRNLMVCSDDGTSSILLYIDQNTSKFLRTSESKYPTNGLTYQVNGRLSSGRGSSPKALHKNKQNT